MPQNLVPFNQLPTLSTNNESTNPSTTRLPPIQTLTQYYYPPKPVPFIPLFPSLSKTLSDDSAPHVSNPIKTSNLVFHQVNPNLFPTPVPTLYNQQKVFKSETSQLENVTTRKRNQSCMPTTSHLTFVNINLKSPQKALNKQPPIIENSFQVSSVLDKRKELRGESKLVPIRNDLNTNNMDSSNRRKNKKQGSTTNNDITLENPQEESNPFRTTSNRNLPKQAVSLMKEWLFSHQEYPYPTEEEKLQIQNETGLSQKRINYWFINARRRLLQKRPSREIEINESYLTTNESSKRCRKNSIFSTTSTNTNTSSVTNVSSYSSSNSNSMSEISRNGDSENEEKDEAVITQDDSMQVDSWVVDCLLDLRENKP